MTATTLPAADASIQPQSILNINLAILGHVDSGKTSLVKALSTHLSTAALDKSRQSRDRGMTLDLGFSCFYLNLPTHLQTAFPEKTALQMTLVDCPGHASLIRTIIGGAQIVDLVLLVVDAQKGWQAQTTECLVLAELTSPYLIVALNKADLLVGADREEQLQAAASRVRIRLANSRFKDSPIIDVAACVGGEKVAAATDESLAAVEKHASLNMEKLVNLLQSNIPVPKRSSDGPFYFSIDHCFALKGRGTVLTGTVLSGQVSVNDVLEFPTLGLDRKVKSMQMFKRQISRIQQGDRAGICVSNLDAKLLERGIAASPGAVQVWRGGIAVVRGIKYYNGLLPSGSKFHISVGHVTVMANVTFWGASELQTLQDQLASNNLVKSAAKCADKKQLNSSSLGGGADIAGLPRLSYDFNQQYLQQEHLVEKIEGSSCKLIDNPPLQWAFIHFQTPVHCPIHSLIIGSRLDAVDNNASGTTSSCRLSFAGRLVEALDPIRDIPELRIYVPKEKRGTIGRLGDAHKRSDDDKVVRYEVFGSGLFKKETNMKPFVGMKIETEQGDIGVIKSSYGTDGMFRVFFPAGTEARQGDALILRFKRYAHDPSKSMHQDMQLPPDRPGARIEAVKKSKKLPDGVSRHGTVSAVKGDMLANGKHNQGIIAGLFAPEINVKDSAGAKVLVVSTKEEGAIVGPFGKAGKCKVLFEQGISAEVGAKVELLL
ncbi:hypothetical protein MPSEU_000800800 [Mayamaea pseudoterrestris]|nr:hypothetical protein MPSEU_000800800 [Mayamaea pseudoterrestris]